MDNENLRVVARRDTCIVFLGLTHNLIIIFILEQHRKHLWRIHHRGWCTVHVLMHAEVVFAMKSQWIV